MRCFFQEWILYKGRNERICGLHIPKPVSPSSSSVSEDELGVFWDCGGRGGGGGMGGSGWVFPRRRWVIWLSWRWGEGMTGQEKQTELRCEVILGASQRLMRTQGDWFKGCKTNWKESRKQSKKSRPEGWQENERWEGGRTDGLEEEDERKGTHPYAGVLTTHCWMNRMPSALTVANKGQRQRGGGGGERSDGDWKEREYVFSLLL